MMAKGICGSSCKVCRDVTTAPSSAIKVTSPNGGEKWQRGKTYTVKWTRSGSAAGGNVKIELLKAGKVVGTIAASTPNDGSQNWTASATGVVGNDFKIRITKIGTKYSDTSNGNFTLIAAAKTPMPTKTPTLNYTINWVSFAKYNKGDTKELVKCNPILSSELQGPVAFMWGITATGSPQMKVKITWTVNGVNYSTTVGPYSVKTGTYGTFMNNQNYAPGKYSNLKIQKV